MAAIGLWSTATGFLRSVTQIYGPLGGTALIYTVGAVALFAFFGRPRLRKFNPVYLIVGTTLFVGYEVCMSLALGFSTSDRQAIEVALVNYMWPSLTILLAIFMNGQNTRWGFVPGTAVALFGIVWVVSGDGLSCQSMANNLASNPISYGLAAAALAFAMYCNVTRRFAGGGNGVPLFFLVTAAVLWIKYGVSDESLPAFTLKGTAELATAGVSMPQAMRYGT